MKIAKSVAVLLVAVMSASSAIAAEADEEAFGQFQEYLLALEQESFEMAQEFLDQTDLTNRILNNQRVLPDIDAMFRAQFWEIIESGFRQAIAPVAAEAQVDLVQFDFENGQGRACVRFSLAGHEYQYHMYELRHDRRGRLKVADWFDTNQGMTFTVTISQELQTIKPIREETRKLLTINGPTDTQIFQATELLKAIRDRQAQRFFEIYEEFDHALRKEPWIARHAVLMAHSLQDVDRFGKSYLLFTEVFREDPNVALIMSDFALMLQDYDGAYIALKRFDQFFAVTEGALPAKLSALALALGKPEEAETFAVEATKNEPDLELAWWSLLRARAGAADFSGSLEALTYLEDNFDQRLDVAKLRRDKFRAFGKLVQSQEYKDWRASRP